MISELFIVSEKQKYDIQLRYAGIAYDQRGCKLD